ncbi:MAG: hypothetical protein ACI8RD_004185, partial [Bacillariaceae sp.]
LVFFLSFFLSNFNPPPPLLSLSLFQKLGIQGFRKRGREPSKGTEKEGCSSCVG